MSACAIYPVSQGELGRCAQVVRHGFADVAQAYGLTAQSCPTNAAFITEERLLADFKKGVLMYALAFKGELVGFMALENKPGGVFVLEKLTVLPEYRRMGCGKALLDFAKHTAAQRGAGKIVIGIIDSNAPLKRWYIKNGFTHTGTAAFAHLPFMVGFMKYEVV